MFGFTTDADFSLRLKIQPYQGRWLFKLGFFLTGLSRTPKNLFAHVYINRYLCCTHRKFRSLRV